MIAVRRLLKRRKYLTFALGNEEYGFDAARVEEILPLRQVQRIEPLHSAPRYFKGVATVRGRVASVISVRMKLGMREGAETDRTCVILTTLAENIRVGWVVDRVRDIIDIDLSDIRPHPFPPGGGTGGVLGLVRRGGRATILLDVEELLGTPPNLDQP